MTNPLTKIQSTVQAQLKDLPSIDFSKISLKNVSLPKVNIPSIHSIDLTKLDLSNVKSTLKVDDIVESAPVKAARDAGYTAVGFAVLAFQKVQVRRRELTEALKSRMNTAQ